MEIFRSLNESVISVYLSNVYSKLVSELIFCFVNLSLSSCSAVYNYHVKYSLLYLFLKISVVFTVNLFFFFKYNVIKYSCLYYKQIIFPVELDINRVLYRIKSKQLKKGFISCWILSYNFSYIFLDYVSIQETGNTLFNNTFHQIKMYIYFLYYCSFLWVIIYINFYK